MTETLEQYHKRKTAERVAKYMACHWMPEKAQRVSYVMGVPYPVQDIDAEKAKQREFDEEYEFNNGVNRL